jgi:hypothetical protein
VSHRRFAFLHLLHAGSSESNVSRSVISVISSVEYAAFSWVFLSVACMAKPQLAELSVTPNIFQRLNVSVRLEESREDRQGCWASSNLDSICRGVS